MDVVVPVHDGERFVAAALESVRDQDGVDIRILVVDDASPDDSAGIARTMAAAGAQVSVLTHDENRGVAAARNTGLEAVDADLVAFCDQDDLWTPGRLARQITTIERTGAAVVLGLVEHFVEPGLDTPAWFQDRWGAGPLPAWLLGAALIRREVFDVIGRFGEDLRHGTDDVAWFAAVMAAGLAVEMPDDVVLRRRVHDRNLSRMTAAHNAELLAVMREAAAVRRRAGTGDRLVR